MNAEEMKLWRDVYAAVVSIPFDINIGRSQEAEYQANTAVKNFRKALSKDL